MNAPAPHARELDLFDLAPDAMAHLDAEGGVIRANAAFRAVFRHAITPSRPPWGRIAAPPFRRGQRRFDAAAPDGRIYEWLDRRLPDGTRLIVAREVTDRVTAAKEVSAAKTRLFATLTHELRTPLNGVLGMAGLIGQSRLDPEACDHLRALKQSGEHLLDLITEILDYSRLESGRVELDSVVFDAQETLQSVAELLSPKAHEKNLEIAAVLRPGAPRWLKGDVGRVRQILFNLAGNAVKFTEQGGVLLELAPRGRDLVRLSVRDTGPGVSMDKQSVIFEEFTQVDASISRRYGGAGLGLAIVRKLAHAMGGAVGVDSRAGEGASFWVDAPLLTVPAPEGRRTPDKRLDGARLRILTPNVILAEAIGALAAARGGTVARAHPRMSDWADCDALLLDAAALRSLDADDVAFAVTEARCVVALIPQEDREAILRFRAMGVAHYALKPVRAQTFVERIRIALGYDADEHPDQRAQEERQTMRPFEGMRVLLAEDNPVNALLARTVLTRAGASVDLAADGVEAAESAARTAYGLIFLDLRMPRADGFAAAKRIRALPAPFGSAPIIALTADSSDADRARAMAVGMDDFIEKPFDLSRLDAVASRFTQAPKTDTA
ncbi:MAG: response regulator [Hyphomonadaceae bacterium]|nr:response regulator [Hyphomonadaceae bacterium]